MYVNPPQELQVAHKKTLTVVRAADLLSNTLLLTGLGIGVIAVVWFRGADIQGLLLSLATINCGMARVIQYSEKDARDTLKAQRTALGDIKAMNASAEVEAQLSPQPIKPVVDKSAALLRELVAMLPAGNDKAFVETVGRKFGDALGAHVARELLAAYMMAPSAVIPPVDCSQAIKKALLSVAVAQYTGVENGWDLLAYDQQNTLRGMPLFVGLCPQPAATADLGFNRWNP